MPIRAVATVNTISTVSIAVCGLCPAESTVLPVRALSRMSTVPVGESMPVASGGIVVVQAIQSPPMLLPISMAQIAVGMPALSSLGNMRAANETMFAIRRNEATRPAIAALMLDCMA